jgi:hypothetical protein
VSLQGSEFGILKIGGEKEISLPQIPLQSKKPRLPGEAFLLHPADLQLATEDWQLETGNWKLETGNKLPGADLGRKPCKCNALEGNLGDDGWRNSRRISTFPIPQEWKRKVVNGFFWQLATGDWQLETANKLPGADLGRKPCKCNALEGNVGDDDWLNFRRISTFPIPQDRKGGS